MAIAKKYKAAVALFDRDAQYTPTEAIDCAELLHFLLVRVRHFVLLLLQQAMPQQKHALPAPTLLVPTISLLKSKRE